MINPYTDEELNDLHGDLYALLSFLDSDAIRKITGDDKLVENHVRALVRSLNDIVFDHGGRQYQPFLTTKTQNGNIEK